MDVAALCLLLLLNFLESGSAQVSLTVSPVRSQFFKFDSFSVSCEEEEQDEDEGSGRAVMKRTADGEVHVCPNPCSIRAAFPATDSGAYWCQTGQEATSNAVNITVTAGPVILESPALPVMEGGSVTLGCRGKGSRSAGSPTADFYKDGVLIQTASTGYMTIANVSTEHEGRYKCNVSESGHSPESWLSVRASAAAASEPPHSLLPHVRHLLVGSLYLVSTVLLGLVYKDRKRERAAELRPTPDGVTMQTV